MHIVERQFRLMPILSPTADEQGEELLVRLEVVRIALALIPHHALDGILRERQDSGLIAIHRHKGVTTQAASVGPDILLGAFANPWLDEVVPSEILQDRWETRFQGLPIDPRLDGRTAHGVAHQTYGNLQTVA